MTPFLQKLLEVSSEPLVTERTSVRFSNTVRQIPIENELADLLNAKNGFFAFESALHVFSEQSSQPAIGMVDWNDSELWKKGYQGMADNLLCFAQDIFANQFCVRNDDIVVFHCESGSVEYFADSLDDWAQKILGDFEFLTGYTFARDWQKLHGRLPLPQRLCPNLPFMLGGEYDVENMRAIEAVTIMKIMSGYAVSTKRVPDGGKICFQAGSG